MYKRERAVMKNMVCGLVMCSLIFGCMHAMRMSSGESTRYISQGHARIAIIGAGCVGATTAYAILLKNIASDIMLVDINDQRCQGEVLDLSDAIPASSTARIIKGTFKDAALADIIIITAGARRKPGQSRLDLIKINQSIITTIINHMIPINPKAVIIMVSNPVDIMTFCAQKNSQLPANQVFGSGTYLDTLRLRGTLSEKLGISQQSIQAYILGEHGDNQFAVWSSANIAGLPLKDFPSFDREQMDALAQSARQKGNEIISLKDATYYGIGICVAHMCESIIFNQKRVIPVSCYLEEHGVCLSMPAIIGENGIEHVVQVPLDAIEQEKLLNAVHAISQVIAQCTQS